MNSSGPSTSNPPDTHRLRSPSSDSDSGTTPALAASGSPSTSTMSAEVVALSGALPDSPPCQVIIPEYPAAHRSG